MQKMDALIITPFPQITALEVRELIGKETQEFQGVCTVRDVSTKQLGILSYHIQSASRICLLLAQSKSIQDLSFSELNLFKNKSFGVEHIKIKEDQTTSTSFAKTIGGMLQGSTQSKVDLSHPDIKVISCNDEFFFVGVDLIGFDMSKRPYKLMAYPGSINGLFAYSLVRLAGVQVDSVVADPFCGSATIPIETALFQKSISPFQFGKKLYGVEILGSEFEKLKPKDVNISVQGFDNQVKVMLTAQKNAKIAGVHDSITISKVAIDWIDAKFAEHEVDFIVTNPPKINKRTKNEKQIIKVYDELFYQAKYILKKQGTIALLLNRKKVIETIASKYGFLLQSIHELHSGKQEYFYYVFSSPA